MEARTQELHESTRMIDDSEGLRKHIGEDGYVFFRDLLDRESVLRVAASMLRIAQRHGWLEFGDPWSASLRGESRGLQDPAYWAVLVDVQKLESLHRVAHDPRLLGIVRRILGDDAFCVPSKATRMMWPGPRHADVHQDYPILQLPDSLTAWIPLADIPYEVGGLSVYPGSQNRGPFDQENPPYTPDEGGWATTDYRAGDVILFHCLTAHYGRPNSSNRLRVSMDTRYMSASDEILPSLLTPDQHPVTPGYDILTRGWSTDKWVRVPEGVKVADGSLGRPHRPSSLVRIPDGAVWSAVPTPPQGRA